MKNILLLLGVSIVMFKELSAQTINLAEQYKQVDYVGASPEASALLGVGKGSVSLSTGALNLTIPLYSLGVSGYTLPIGLSYTTKGVRVDDISSSAGLGWALQAGGVVTRTVLDMPDESRTTYSKNNFNAPSLDSVSSLALYYYLLEDELIDSECDIFQFNVAGLSGNFYLDSTLTPVLMTKQKIRIEMLPGTTEAVFAGFLITDDKGIQYEFSVLEKSRKYNVGGAACKNSWEVDVVTPMITAWQLSKIKINSRDSILFSYQSAFEVYQASISQRVSKGIESWQLPGCPGEPAAQAEQLGLDQFSQCMAMQENTIQQLTEIRCSNGAKAVFTYGFQRQEVNGYGLSDVKIFNSKNELIKRYGLVMESVASNNTIGIPTTTFPLTRYDQNAIRSFLRRLDEIDITDSTKRNVHFFHYDAPQDLPPRLSFAQDHWGYYNGQNNAYMFADVPGQPQNKMFDGTAVAVSTTRWVQDREPHAPYMYKGVLSKIVYPTGGHEEFAYSSAAEKRYTPQIQQASATVSSLTVDLSSSVKKDTIYLPFAQMIAISSSCTRTVAEPDFHGSCEFQLIPLDPNRTSGTGYNSTVQHPPVNSSLFLDSGLYVMSAHASALFDSTLATFSVTYQANDPVIVETSTLLGGVVVGAVKKYTQEDALAEETQYEYSSASDEYSTVKKMVDLPSYYSNDERWTYPTCTTFGIPYPLSEDPFLVLKSVVLNSSIIGPLSVLGASPYYFTSVKEYQVSPTGQRNGMIKHKFLFADAFPFIKDPFQKHGNMINGTPFGVCPEFVIGENETEIYKESKGVYTLQKKSTSFYSAEMLPKAVNQVIYEKYGQVLFRDGDNIFIDGFDVSTYMLQGMQVRLDSVREEIFESNGSYNVLTKLQYENPAYPYPTKKTAINSKNEVVSQQFVYPQDVVSTGYNSSGIITKMLNRNILSLPVEIIEKNADVQKNKTVTKFREFPASSNDIVIDTTIRYASSTTVPAERVYFSAYDSHGNALTVSTENNVDVSYIWGYNHQYPIAKIVGKSYSTVLSQSGVDTAVLNSLSVTEAQRKTELDKLYTLTGCFVTTYLYKPLVGMTSQTDPRGRVTSYEYDGFGRLRLIKDHDGNVVKTYDYHYKGNLD